MFFVWTKLITGIVFVLLPGFALKENLQKHPYLTVLSLITGFFLLYLSLQPLVVADQEINNMKHSLERLQAVLKKNDQDELKNGIETRATTKESGFKFKDISTHKINFEKIYNDIPDISECKVKMNNGTLNYIGDSYFLGTDGKEKNYQKALACYKYIKYSNSGQYNAGIIYTIGGFGINKDYLKALYWFYKTVKTDESHYGRWINDYSKTKKKYSVIVLQYFLKKYNYYKGSINGIFDESTKSASSLLFNNNINRKWKGTIDDAIFAMYETINR